MVNNYGLEVASLRNDAENFHQTPLFEACAIKDQDKALRLVQFLLSQGVNPAQSDDLNQLPLYYAVREGHTQIIDIFVHENKINVNHLDTYQQTPIFYSVRDGKMETTQQLLNAGANPDVVDTNGQTPIYYAIKHSRYEMCELLISKGINVQHEDKYGKSPTMFAKKNNKNQIVELLLQHGGDLKEKKKEAPPRAAPKVVEEKPKVNERKVPKRYLLTTLREGGFYEPLTDAEFEKFKLENPEVAQYFLVGDDE